MVEESIEEMSVEESCKTVSEKQVEMENETLEEQDLGLDIEDKEQRRKKSKEIMLVTKDLVQRRFRRVISISPTN